LSESLATENQNHTLTQSHSDSQCHSDTDCESECDTDSSLSLSLTNTSISSIKFSLN